MRIVLDLQACQATNRERGIGRYSMSLALAMARNARGHDIRIALNSAFPESIEPLRQAFDSFLPNEHLTVFDVPEAISGSTINTWRRRAAERVREAYLASLAPDIVHVASLFEGWVDDAVTSVSAFGNGFCTGFDTAITLYDLIPLLRKETYLTDARMRDWYYRKLQALKNAGQLLAISESSRQEAITALQLPGDRVVNISTAADDIFRPLTLSLEASGSLKQRFQLNKPFLMYTGGIDYRKNIEGLIEAFALLPSSIREQYQLAIICKIHDDDRQRLESLVLRSGLKKTDVVFTGFVAENDLVALYNSATLFVFPSLHEGFGLPVLEAMSCGIPVIGSNSSSIPEVIGFKDALFDPSDTRAISTKIYQALNDDSFRSALREHGLEQAKKFSWDASAERALTAFEELHEQQREKREITVAVKSSRPRLAYVSPLPPEKSGIADYSAELLPELARFYDIEVVTEQAIVTDPWLAANFPLRSVAWFAEHADSYDRIIYHFGNSAFHQHMFGLLPQYPGIVVLHDFFLSGVVNYLDHSGYLPGALSAGLYESHGYVALIAQKNRGREAAIWEYPCNKNVLDRAAGVIVHSHFSASLADAWYGPGSASAWRYIPHLRALPGTVDRQAARKALGLADTDLVICSFGLLGITKLNERLLEAWLNSPLAADARCHLIFVGENDAGAYGKKLSSTIAASARHDRIKITGFASTETYRAYLAAADFAVQLRARSRGETSGTVLDCLAHGIPTIVNAHGSSADLPDNILLKLKDEFSQAELEAALLSLWSDTALGQRLSRQGIEHIHREHHPARIGEQYRDAIEHFTVNSPVTAYQRLIGSLSSISETSEFPAEDMMATAASIAANSPQGGGRQLLVDVSELVQRDAKSGIQRVVRNILDHLLKSPPEQYRIEPVFDDGNGYRYARQFTLGLLELPSFPGIENAVIETHAGDIFLGLDLHPSGVPRHEQTFIRLRNRGVKVCFVVYDLLPILRPDVFVAGAEKGFTSWLRTVTKVADGLICISKAVADDLVQWIETQNADRSRQLKISHFHLGADIVEPLNEITATNDLPALPEAIGQAPSLLMVGTIEPRKAHSQALDAFERLWAEGRAVNLVIVGKKGWLVEELIARIQRNPQLNRHLFWFEGASDSQLLQLYNTAAALLAASEAEGFGLPLIEAAQHKLPLIVRDIPVFREVAGEHAYYFEGKTTESLATALRQWLDLHASEKAPPSHGLPWLSWQQSTQQLLACVIGPAATAN